MIAFFILISLVLTIKQARWQGGIEEGKEKVPEWRNLDINVEKRHKRVLMNVQLGWGFAESGCWASRMEARCGKGAGGKLGSGWGMWISRSRSFLLAWEWLCFRTVNLGGDTQAEWNGAQGSGKNYIPFDLCLVLSYDFISSTSNGWVSGWHTKEKDVCLAYCLEYMMKGTQLWCKVKQCLSETGAVVWGFKGRDWDYILKGQSREEAAFGKGYLT